jgi:hypothetical protein
MKVSSVLFFVLTAAVPFRGVCQPVPVPVLDGGAGRLYEVQPITMIKEIGAYMKTAGYTNRLRLQME